VTAALKFDVSARVFAAALLATVVALAGGVWFLSIAPKHSKASTLETAIQADQSKLSAALRAQHEAATTQSKAAQLNELRSALPDALAMPQILDQLDGIAHKSGVTLDAVTPSPPIVGIGYQAVPLTVVVDGRFFAVKKFLQLMRTQVSIGKVRVQAKGRLFDVSGFQLNETEPAPTVTATFQMEAFYFAPSAQPVQPLTTSTTTTPAS
jgi:Pilus assembly protein, PilO